MSLFTTHSTFNRFLTGILASIMLVMGVAACDNDEASSGATDADGNPLGQFVSIEMEDDLGTIVIELVPEEAPITVANFQNLVHEGFYDGLTFHRIISGFMIQGGDPLGTGQGGSDTQIKGEFSANGVENNLKHVRGTVSMARGGHDMDSASSQFFICVNDEGVAHLDGDYAAFGTVISGIEVADKIVENYLMTPGYAPKMASVTLSDTKP